MDCMSLLINSIDWDHSGLIVEAKLKKLSRPICYLMWVVGHRKSCPNLGSGHGYKAAQMAASGSGPREKEKKIYKQQACCCNAGQGGKKQNKSPAAWVAAG